MTSEPDSLEQRDDLITYLLQELRPGDVVLLKGSRGLQMEDIVDRLRVPADKSVLTSDDEV